MTTNDSLSRLSDAELLIEVKRLAAIEREATADLIRSLAEVEARRLHLAIGCSSMFGYCTQVLHLSEHAAYARIAAARAATRFPVVMNLLIEGAITLTTVTLLGRHLTAENHAALLESARHKSKADVEMLVATLHPQPDVPSSVRKVPAPKPPGRRDGASHLGRYGGHRGPAGDDTGAAEPRHRRQPAAVVRAIAPERYKLQVTIGAETRAKLRRAQDLLRHTNRSADEAAVIDRALTVLVEQLEKVKYGRTDRPRARPAESGFRSRLTPCPRASATRGQRTRRRSMRLRRARRPLHRDGRAPVPSPHSLRRWRADDRRQSRIALPGAQRLRSRAVVRATVRAGDRRRVGANLVWTKLLRLESVRGRRAGRQESLCANELALSTAFPLRLAQLGGSAIGVIGVRIPPAGRAAGAK